MRLGHLSTSDSVPQYGLIFSDDRRHRAPCRRTSPASNTLTKSTTLRTVGSIWTAKERLVALHMSLGSIAFLLFAAGLFVLIVYYNCTFDNTPFDAFMRQKSAHFLFTSLGVGISLFWASVFKSGYHKPTMAAKYHADRVQIRPLPLPTV